MEAESAGRRFALLGWALDERLRRLFSATEAKELGRGGVTAVAAATGVSRRAIHVGLKELAAQEQAPQERPRRVRRPGAGRKRLTELDPTLLADLERLIEPLTRGDPQSALRWTCKSLRRLSEELRAQGHRVSHTVVGELLRGMGYSLQANVKTLEGSGHPDRNAQFEHIYREVERRLGEGQPVISVDTKKKELIGPYKNSGRTWRAKGLPEEVKVHDFIDPELGRVNPYGVYDLAANAGWVCVGTDNDTAAFAVQTIRRWWEALGRPTYGGARELLITADGGGSNGRRVRLWKTELQRLADETGLAIRVCHFPPGTSKWNKIEHRLFCHITQNWRGKPLRTFETIVDLIGSTRTEAGLRVKAKLDKRKYPTGAVTTNAQMEALALHPNDFHGEWNYEIRPQRQLID